MHSLRIATAADIPALQRIRSAVRENRLVSRTISDEEVLEAIEVTGCGWVALEGEEIVGFAIGNAETGNIWALFVHPDHEGRGLGQRLHDTLVAWLFQQGLDRLWLTTEPDTRAEAFYRRRGWRPTGPADHGDVGFELASPFPGRPGGGPKQG